MRLAGAVVAIAAAGAVGLVGPALAAGGPTGSTTTTTTTTAPGSGGAFITFGGGGSFGSSFSISTGTSRSLGSSGPFGTTATLHGVGRRTTGGQVQLRVFEGSLSPPPGTGFPGFLSASCLPNRQVLVDVSTDVVAGSVAFYGRSDRSVAPQASYVGQSEGSPVAVVAAQVPNDTQAAIMHFAGGPTDKAAPLPGGWVVLAARVKVPPVLHRPVPLLTDTTPPPLGTLSTVDRLGRAHPVGSVPAAIGYAIPSSCVPRPPTGSSSQPVIATPATTTPSTLPQPTGPGPADPGRARQAVEYAYRRVFESPAGRNNNRYLQGGAVLNAAERQQLVAGYGDILGKIRVRINDFRFLNPTRAALSFDLLLNGQPISPATIGEAILVKGQWQVARASFCAVIARANITCG